jgi:hypothetical protein
MPTALVLQSEHEIHTHLPVDNRPDWAFRPTPLRSAPQTSTLVRHRFAQFRMIPSESRLFRNARW